jgi:hypothetical protein
VKKASVGKQETVCIYITSESQEAVNATITAEIQRQGRFHFITRHTVISAKTNAATTLGVTPNTAAMELLWVHHSHLNSTSAENVLSLPKTFLAPYSVYYLDVKKFTGMVGNAAHVPVQLAFDLLTLYCAHGTDNRILDFNCGTGSFAVISLLQSYSYWGCDTDTGPVKKKIAAALAYFQNSGDRARDQIINTF